MRCIAESVRAQCPSLASHYAVPIKKLRYFAVICHGLSPVCNMSKLGCSARHGPVPRFPSRVNMTSRLVLAIARGVSGIVTRPRR